MTPEESYRATVHELLALANNAPHVTQADVLEIASMPVEELRRRAIRQRDWAGHWSRCLDGLGVWKLPGAAPDGCWMPREVRSVVEQLLRKTPAGVAPTDMNRYTRATMAGQAHGIELGTAMALDALDAFERKERGIPQAHMAAELVRELRAALLATDGVGLADSKTQAPSHADGPSAPKTGES
jgi:hypothetical protein